MDLRDVPGTANPCGLLLFDRDGLITSWDTVLERVTGIPGAEMLGKHVLDLPFLTTGSQEITDREAVRERISAGPEGAGPLFRNRATPSPGGEDLAGEPILFVLPAGGSIRGGIILCPPAGNGEEAALREMNRKLLAASSTVRHDINNQLTILNGYLSLMEGGAEGIETGEILKILLGASDKIGRILRFTREYQDIGTKPPEWFGLGETIRLARASPGAEAIRLVFDPLCESIEILADPEFPRVFFHLIDNSVRHGQKVTEIHISCAVKQGILEIVYQDDGIGIPVKVRPALFQQGKGKTSYGLFLSREILKITGITIDETGAAGTGARFVITVPSGAFREGNGT